MHAFACCKAKPSRWDNGCRSACITLHRMSPPTLCCSTKNRCSPAWRLSCNWCWMSRLLPPRETYVSTHPWGCHRRRIADRIVFDKPIQVPADPVDLHREAAADLARAPDSIPGRGCRFGDYLRDSSVVGAGAAPAAVGAAGSRWEGAGVDAGSAACVVSGWAF